MSRIRRFLLDLVLRKDRFKNQHEFWIWGLPVFEVRRFSDTYDGNFPFESVFVCHRLLTVVP